jgi:class 3 adenylate cyclase/tetratricopeptide (TPR) repeat protein
MAACPSCGRELPGEFPFCPFCGAPLAAATAAGEERKVVTCLFCDLVGFTARAERLDPEDVRAMLAPYHARVRAELERHGGTVEKFIGDAVMAVFGAPAAHEDDPERAVRAALAIRDSARDDGIELRIGIATGEALVNLGARPAEGEGMASGDVVNTAARLQAAAPVYGVVVGETTYRATRRTIEYREVDAIAAKGKAEPVPAWEAVEARARLGAEVLDYTAGRLVGRAREHDLLRSTFERVRDERSPQLVTLVGVPGIGKSRLVHELSRIADADPDLITWRQGRCLAYGEGVTFWALAEIVKAQAGILEADTPEDAAQRLHAAVHDAIAEPQEAAWIEARLRPLAGLESEGELAGDRRGESFAAWRRFFEALADRRPFVAVFEDLQWADDGLLDFVDELADRAAGVPLLLVCTARPELLSRRPGWGGGKLNATTIALAPLSEAETALLISQVLERSVLPAESQRSLLERAEGNPLYAEQFALLYAERGTAEELPLPESLQGIVAARLDGLPAAEKALLQDASVVGKVFWTGCLQPESDPLLRELTRKGFVRRQLRSSVAAQDEYAFGHVLVRDVAYGQIPRGERSRRHRTVAGWIESLGRPDDHAEMVAHHLRSALELARAAGSDDAELVDRARFALRNAGDRASTLNAHAAAEGYYSDALGLWPYTDPSHADLLFRRARALHLENDERREQALAEARDALVAAGDRAQAAEASAFLARIAWYRGAHEESRLHLATALDLVAEEPPSPAKARVLATAARQQTLGGEIETGELLAEEALTMAQEFGQPELESHALTTIGSAKMDRDQGGREELERALEIAVAANSPEAAGILVNLGVEAFFAGDIRREHAFMVEAEETAERYGARDIGRFSLGNRIFTCWALGGWDEALGLADDFIAECERSPHYQEQLARNVRAWIRYGRGDDDGAMSDAERTLEQVRQGAGPQSTLGPLAQCSFLYAKLGRPAEARALAAEALEYARAHPHFAGPLHMMTPVARELGIQEELRDVLAAAPERAFNQAARAGAAGDHSRAADLYAAMGSPSLEALHRLAAAESLLTAGRREEGEAELERALAFYRSVGATAHIERGETLLTASA